MKLLDAATVTEKPLGDWEHGWDGDSRACAGIHVYLSECDPAVTSDVIGDENDVPNEDCGYRVIPFGIVADFTRTVRAAKDDDQSWLEQALRDGAEIPVSRGLLVRQGAGDVWIGNEQVREVPAPVLTDMTAIARSVAEARRLFFSNTLGIEPILHVHPDSAILLKKAGVVELDPANGEDRTAWGDQVVISSGYYDIPDLSRVPLAFFTGPIDITLSPVMSEELIRNVRMNKMMYQATMVAAIDTEPCAMVRIGPAPAPAAP